MKLQRRLRNLQQIDDDRAIDRTFISYAEYQLFLDEMREKKEFYQPDHWLDFHFPKGSALQPIAGVRAPDVEKFCDWLSQKEHKKYRCPTLKEAQEFLATDNYQFATWCNDGSRNEWNLQWNSPKTKQDLELKLKQFHNDNLITQYIEQQNLVFSPTNLKSNRSIDYDRAHQLARDLKNYLHKPQESNNSNQYKKNQLRELEVILNTDDVIEQQQAWRRYIAHWTRESLIDYENLEKKEDKCNWWQRLLHGKARNYAEEKRILALWCVWVEIIEARQKGRFPVSEGIRTVRDHKDFLTRVEQTENPLEETEFGNEFRRHSLLF